MRRVQLAFVLLGSLVACHGGRSEVGASLPNYCGSVRIPEAVRTFNIPGLSGSILESTSISVGQAVYLTMPPHTKLHVNETNKNTICLAVAGGPGLIALIGRKQGTASVVSSTGQPPGEVIASEIKVIVGPPAPKT